MKSRENLNSYRSMNLTQLQQAIKVIEKELAGKRLEVRFGKAKDVRTIRSLKHDLARSLTIAREQLAKTGEMPSAALAKATLAEKPSFAATSIKAQVDKKASDDKKITGKDKPSFTKASEDK